MSQDKTVKIYVCGPTTYDHPHLGHARCYVIVDLIRRILGPNAFLVMNITDIDDKIINRAQEENTTPALVAQKYEKSFWSAMTRLGVTAPDLIVRVTDCITDIIAYAQKIIDNGFAYVTDNGSVYFDSEAFLAAGYESEHLIDEDETIYETEVSPLVLLQKKNRKDFVLWKSREPEDFGYGARFRNQAGMMIESWGRPGWHIECSAMIHKTIGLNFDYHFGGIDLKFPHHHNEELQAKAFYHPILKERSWVSEFHHIGHLCIAGLKMSKSLKNFTTIDDALKTLTANQLRWLFIRQRWTECMDFTPDTVIQAQNLDAIVVNFLRRVDSYPWLKLDAKATDSSEKLLQQFQASRSEVDIQLENFRFDLVTQVVFDLISKTNAYLNADHPNESVAIKIRNWIRSVLVTLGFLETRDAGSDNSAQMMDVLIATRSRLRELSRNTDIPSGLKSKIFEILDQQRNHDLPNIGIQLQDTKTSSSWHFMT